jgi:hypothetical protein
MPLYRTWFISADLAKRDSGDLLGWYPSPVFAKVTVYLFEVPKRIWRPADHRLMMKHRLADPISDAIIEHFAVLWGFLDCLETCDGD